MSTIIVCVLAYVIVVGLFNMPGNRPMPVAKAVGAMPINYFPEVLEDEEDDCSADEVTAMLVDAVFSDSSDSNNADVRFVDVAPELVHEPCLSSEPESTFSVPDYSAMSIRQLKAECKQLTGTPRAIKGYSKLSKAELIARLSA